MNGEYVILPKDGLGFRLGKGQCMRVVDVEGQQVADVMAYHEKDFYEKFDQGATMDSLFSSKVKKGDQLYSNLYKPMFTVIEDTVECHDLYILCVPARNVSALIRQDAPRGHAYMLR